MSLLPDDLSPSEALLAIEEIKQVFSARLRVMDTRQWHLYAGLHTDDVVSETWGGLPSDTQPVTDGSANRVVGNQTLANTIQQLLDGPVQLTTVHQAHTPEIELTSATTARGVWAMEDHLWWIDEATGEELHLHGYGHYHEEYRRVDGRWLISYRSLSRLRVDAPADFWRFSAAL